MSTQHYLVHEERHLNTPPQSKLLYLSTSQYNTEWNCALHTNVCSELFFITGGHGRFQAHQEKFPVAVHDLVVVNAGIPHAQTSQSDNPLEYIVLGVEGLDAFSGTNGFALLHLSSGWDEVMACLRLMLQEADSELPGFGLVCQHLLEVILLRLRRREDFSLSPNQRLSCRGSRECDLVRRYIDNHFKENLSLDQLSAIARINKYYLVHAFRKEFNTSPINYLIARRIQESRFLLAETNQPLSQIAQTLGFSSLSYFSQSFRRLEGITPKAYRKRHRG